MSVTMRWVTAACVVCAVVVGAAVSHACDTPVYQYSMYTWERDIYRVRYFHRTGEQPAVDAAANAVLRSTSTEGAGAANIKLIDVPVAADGTVPEEHRKAWESRGEAEPPLHVITSPITGTLWAGRLSEAMARSLVSSPKRTELAEKLSAGRTGVLVALINDAAGDGQPVVQATRQAVTEGSVEERTLDLVTVRRSDPRERWLVEQLLSVESDLPQIHSSMVFGVFGRGHVLPPYIGEGVSAKGLRGVVRFMHGPCACELKHSNPGIDLLIDWDFTEHLPQWATGTPIESSFVLLDFEEGADGGPPEADPDDNDSDARSVPHAGEVTARRELDTQSRAEAQPATDADADRGRA